MATLDFTAKKPPTTPASGILGLPNNKQFFLWGISALALVALADPLPNLAVGFVLLLILGMLLIHSDDYISLLNASLKPINQSASPAPGAGHPTLQ